MLSPERSRATYTEQTLNEAFAGFRMYHGTHEAELNDLDSCASDLEAAIESLDFYNDSDDPRLKVILWGYAVVAYGRCFGSGVRHAAKPSRFIKLLPKVMQELNDSVLAMRNKHIAHSVNAMERPMTLYRLDERGEALMVTENIRVAPGNGGSAVQLRELAVAVLHLINERQKSLLLLAKREIESVPLADRFAVPYVHFEVSKKEGIEERPRSPLRPKR